MGPRVAARGPGAGMVTTRPSRAGVGRDRSPASAADAAHLQADEGEGDAAPVEVLQQLLEPQHHGGVDAADVRALQDGRARGRCCGDGGDAAETGPPVTRGGAAAGGPGPGRGHGEATGGSVPSGQRAGRAGRTPDNSCLETTVIPLGNKQVPFLP